MPPSNRLYALGRLKPGERNKTEAAYELELERRKSQGEILWYQFEGIKLRLADNCFYSPDFVVLLSNGEMEMHEVKGAKAIMTDDSKVKIKVAARHFPFRFILIFTKPKKDGGGWKVEEL